MTRSPRCSQVHGDDVACVGPEGPSTELHGHLHASADGLVTDQPGVALDGARRRLRAGAARRPRARVIGAAHAGRPGLAPASCPRLSAGCASSAPRDVTAWLGPHVCGRCYEVPREMRDEVGAAVPASRATTSWGTPVPRPRRRGAGPARPSAGSTCVDVSALHARVDRPLLLPPRRAGAGRSGRPGPDGAGMSRPARRARGQPRRRPRPDRRGLRGRGPRRRRGHAWSW